METTLTVEILEGIGFGLFFALSYYLPSLLRKIPGNDGSGSSRVYINENGSACQRRAY